MILFYRLLVEILEIILFWQWFLQLLCVRLSFLCFILLLLGCLGLNNMNDVITVFQFCMNMATQILSFFMSNWVTSIFIIGCVVLLVVNLIFINKDE